MVVAEYRGVGFFFEEKEKKKYNVIPGDVGHPIPILILLPRVFFYNGRDNTIDGRGNAIDGRDNTSDGRGNAIDGRDNTIDGRDNAFDY